MARISYIDEQSSTINHHLCNIIKARRANAKLLNLDKVLLHSEAVTQGWNDLFKQLRQNLSISAALRELIILRIAVINQAPYEFTQHQPEALKAGVSPEKIKALTEWSSSPLFTPEEQAALAYTDAMTRFIQVSDSIYQKLPHWFNEQQIVELTALIAGYNMVSRFLEALQINSDGE